MKARSRHNIFESDFKQEGNGRFTDWWLEKWRGHIKAYCDLGWAMIPIAVRGKRPLSSQPNYASRGAAGPYLMLEDALYWVSKGFNLAVAAGPSHIVWCDIDKHETFENLPLRALSGIERGPLMRTPRGYAFPLKNGPGSKKLEALKSKGFDFREDIMYELVPVSETCFYDHHLGVRIHPGPREKCLTGEAHEYHVREWVTPLTNPMLTIQEFAESMVN